MPLSLQTHGDRTAGERSAQGGFGMRNASSRATKVAGAVLDTQELIDEPSFYERGILQ